MSLLGAEQTTSLLVVMIKMSVSGLCFGQKKFLLTFDQASDGISVGPVVDPVAVSEGIVVGVTEPTLEPGSTTTRAQTAVVLIRLAK